MPSLSPKAAGAETALDVGVFCVGAAAGGLVDALLNSFGFAEPLVVASLGGTGALGLKKMLWDSFFGKASKRTEYKALREEIGLIEAVGDQDNADLLRRLVEEGERTNRDPALIRKLFESYRRRS